MSKDRRGESRRVIVVGAGAAGLMAAGQAAQLGAETIVLEKMSRPGKKLRITGNGRCNLTNEDPLPEFIAQFGPNGRFLRQAFSRFFASELVAFFRELGVPTISEGKGRIFPASGRAQDVVDSLVRWATGCGAQIVTRSAADGLVIEEPGEKGEVEQRVTGVRVSGGQVHRGDAVVIATGGKSYPATGSTGDGYRLAAMASHTIVPIRAALVPLVTAGDVARRLQGLSRSDVSVRVLVEGKRRAHARGELIFTHFGVSGPVILSLSKQVVDALRSGGSVILSLDLEPDLDDHDLDTELRRRFAAHGKQKTRTVLKGLLHGKLAEVCASLADISADKPAHQITAGERKRLRSWLKGFRLEVTTPRPLSEAIVTAGGVDTREVDPRTLASRLADGLYFAGEVLDIDGASGGYNLQAAFSTGWVAGRSAAGGTVPHRKKPGDT